MKAEAIEFLTEPFRADVLWGAIQDAIDRSRTALEGEAQMHTLRGCYDPLSRREREVLVLVVSGR